VVRVGFVIVVVRLRELQAARGGAYGGGDGVVSDGIVYKDICNIGRAADANESSCIDCGVGWQQSLSQIIPDQSPVDV
jgi:hypothetical protein